MAFDVRHSSELARSDAEVWGFVTTIDGIAAEMRPWLRMTAPRGKQIRDLASVPVGEPIGRCWLLLFGVLPVEYDDLVLTEVGDRHFVEQSKLLSARSWRHERRVAPTATGCRVTDHLTLEPRRLVPARLARLVVTAIFAHRHRRLRRLFGVPVQS